jgi:hypothetical protein
MDAVVRRNHIALVACEKCRVSNAVVEVDGVEVLVWHGRVVDLEFLTALEGLEDDTDPCDWERLAVDLVGVTDDDGDTL